MIDELTIVDLARQNGRGSVFNHFGLLLREKFRARIFQFNKLGKQAPHCLDGEHWRFLLSQVLPPLPLEPF
jgi:hypothetical protein